MTTYNSKLIVIRGNSGSGKSTVARELRSRCQTKTALVEQDYLRRIVLKEKETGGLDNISLIEQVVNFSLQRGYNVILEGILYFPRYGEMLDRLRTACPDHYFYYLDVSFEETLRRHATKPNAHEFGEKEMRDWYKPGQYTNFPHEQLLPEAFSADQAATRILADTGL